MMIATIAMVKAAAAVAVGCFLVGTVAAQFDRLFAFTDADALEPAVLDGVAVLGDAIRDSLEVTAAGAVSAGGGLGHFVLLWLIGGTRRIIPEPQDRSTLFYGSSKFRVSGKTGGFSVLTKP